MDKTRRNFMLVAATVAVTSLFGLVSARQAANKKLPPNVNSRLGINLAGIADWGTEFPFVDLFKQSRTWFVEGKELASTGVTLDAHGWVTQLPVGVVASTIISSLNDSHFPNGDYVILYDGEGEINVPNHLKQSAKLGRLLVNVNGEKGAFRLDIVKTNPQNPIKNIHVIAKQYENSYQKNPWNPRFLERWQGVACIRFMDFMATNHSQQISWRDRPHPNDASYANKGVPLELMLDLASRINAEPWFCMPHLADDDYIKQFASTVKATLKPPLRAWVEYSNEVWNGGFEQHKYASKQGLGLKLDKDAWFAALHFNAYRSLQIFKIWTNVYAGHSRFVRVLASQAANDFVSEKILAFEHAAQAADVLAIAPYIHFSVPPTAEDGITEKVVAGWSLDQLFEHLNKKSLTESTQWIINSKIVADKYQLNLVAYEDGQHLAGVAGAENNQQLTQLFLKANADVRMGNLYTRHLKAWLDNGGDLLCHFNSVSGWSKWGSWGLLQYHDDKPTPKFKVVIDWAKSRGQKMTL